MVTKTISIVLLTSYLLAPAAWCADPFQSSIPESDSAILNKTKALRNAKKFDQAIPILEDLVKRNPNYYLAQYSLGLAYADTGDYSKATSRFSEAAKIQKTENITDPTLFNSYGWMLLVKGDYKAAEVQFKAAEKNFEVLAPDSKRKLLNNTGLLYMYKQDYPTARKYLSRSATEFNSDLAKENLKTLDTLTKQKQ